MASKIFPAKILKQLKATKNKNEQLYSITLYFSETLKFYSVHTNFRIFKKTVMKLKDKQ